MNKDLRKNSTGYIKTENTALQSTLDKRQISEPSPIRQFMNKNQPNNKENIKQQRSFLKCQSDILMKNTKPKKNINLERTLTPKNLSQPQIKIQFINNIRLIVKTLLKSNSKQTIKPTSTLANYHSSIVEKLQKKVPVKKIDALETPSVQSSIAKSDYVTESMKKVSEQQTEVKLRSSQSQNNEDYCKNHHSKIAKYKLQNNETACSKCAIHYAILKGVDILPIGFEKKVLTFGQDEEIMNQTNEISQQLRKIQNIQVTKDHEIKKVRITQFLEKLKIQATESQEFEKRLQDFEQKDLIESYGEIIKEVSMNSLKNLLFNNLNQLQINAGIVSITQNLTQYLKDIDSIKKDIIENLENIISNMDISPFNIILSKYNEKIDFFQQNLNSYKEKFYQMQTSKEDCQFSKKLRDSEFQEKITLLFKEILAIDNGSQKFLQLLQKVNQNQSNNHMFYQTLLPEYPQRTDYAQEVKKSPEFKQ